MVVLKVNKDTEDGKMPSEQDLADMMKYNEELAKAGIIVGGEGLHPSAQGKRVRFSGEERLVIDGPFAETKELIAGFWLWQVKSMDEAVEWLKRMPPGADPAPFEVEIRRVFEAADFGDNLTPELRAKEADIRKLAGESG
jgi:hypothetical protein